MSKYIMLFNYDPNNESEAKTLKCIKHMFPKAKIEPYGVFNPKYFNPNISEEFVSVWIPKKQFLSAWIFANVLKTDVIENEFIEEFLDETDINDGINYMKLHLNSPELYVKEY